MTEMAEDEDVSTCKTINTGNGRRIGPMNVPVDSVRVLDAHEEIMELYMSSKHDVVSTGSSSLGHLDASRPIIEMDLVLRDPDASAHRTKQNPSVKGSSRQRRKAGGQDGALAGARKDVEVSIKLQQNLHMLSRSSGDTGSVLWRSSLYLAQHLLSQHHFPSTAITPLFDIAALSSSSILELGCGTGLLAILLSPLCQSYTATDLRDNLDLCARNLELNGIGTGTSTSKSHGVELEEQDWVEISGSAKRRERVGTARNVPDRTYDLVLAVDCIYNEFLVQPFVDTLCHYCQPGSGTIVLVVVELRSSDVLVAFLEAWLAIEGWIVMRLPEGALGLWDGRPGNWVGWIGWRN